MRHQMPPALALVLLLGAPALGQTPEVAEPSEGTVLATELVKLNATLVDIKVLLERITETQGLDLLMKRMELSSAQLTETEKRLRNAESERASVEDERAELEMIARSYAAELESSSIDPSAEQLETFTAQYEIKAARLEDRLRVLDDEIAKLSDILGSKRRELEDWQGYIDRRLGGV